MKPASADAEALAKPFSDRLDSLRRAQHRCRSLEETRMLMSAPVRRLALTAHVTTSVSWMGAVACFLALAITGLASPRPIEVQAAYLAMEVVCWAVIVPLSLLSPATGIAQALWTPWGLVRHYWVLVKLLVTLPCTAILLLHMLPTTRLAAAAAQGQLQGASLHDLRVQLIADSAVAIAVLVFTTVLAIYKPRGTTSKSEPAPTWVKWLRGIALAGAGAFLVAHLLGGGMGQHGLH
ncbi:MAG TPA: hypothetical protein VF169_03395 [Albitalea sp.]|uniref:hypothetical protein n=1 Tax=Piscinibacter sp. TaxID=1903157 RepID=UPI002ED2C23D